MAKDIESLQTRVDELAKDRYDLLGVKTKEGLLASEWLMRTAKAEARGVTLEKLLQEAMDAMNMDWPHLQFLRKRIEVTLSGKEVQDE